MRSESTKCSNMTNVRCCAVLQDKSSRSRISSVYSAVSRASLPSSSSSCQFSLGNIYTRSSDSTYQDDGSVSSNAGDTTRTSTVMVQESDAGAIVNNTLMAELPVVTVRPELNDRSETSTLASSVGLSHSSCGDVSCSTLGASKVSAETTNIRDRGADCTEGSPPSDAAVKGSQNVDMIDQVDDLVGIFVQVNLVAEEDNPDDLSTSTSESVRSMMDKLELETFEPSNPTEDSEDLADAAFIGEIQDLLA